MANTFPRRLHILAVAISDFFPCMRTVSERNLFNVQEEQKALHAMVMLHYHNALIVSIK